MNLSFKAPIWPESPCWNQENFCGDYRLSGVGPVERPHRDICSQNPDNKSVTMLKVFTKASSRPYT